MVTRKNGAVFCADGKTFVVGGAVAANAESAYEGLRGFVKEIRTGDDRETENSTPDIYCAFLAPETQPMRAELEDRFSRLYRQAKVVEDIALDCVIMSPEMLEPLSKTHKNQEEAA